MSGVCRPARLAVGLIVEKGAGRPTCRLARWQGPMVPYALSGRLALWPAIGVLRVLLPLVPLTTGPMALSGRPMPEHHRA